MPTAFDPLDEESRKTLHDMSMGTYLDGECYAFAIALSDSLGWRIIGLAEGYTIRHALVEQPDGHLRDVRGSFAKDDPQLGMPFGHTPNKYDLQIITASDLRVRRPVGERHIRLARRLAEVIWPELPWKHSNQSRVQAFMDDLESISRKHRIWIRAPYPAARPVLADGDDEEGGYVLTPTDDGMTFVFDRYFTSERRS